MIRDDQDGDQTSDMAQAALLVVRRAVVELARRTQTPIIVFVDNEVRSLSPQEFEQSMATEPRAGWTGT